MHHATACTPAAMRPVQHRWMITPEPFMNDSLNSCLTDAAQAGIIWAGEQACNCQLPVDAANKWQPPWTHTDENCFWQSVLPTLNCLTDASSFTTSLTFHRPALPQQSEACAVCLYHHGMLHWSPHVGLAKGSKAALLLILRVQALQHGQLGGSCRGRRVGTISTGLPGQMRSFSLMVSSRQG